MKRLSESALGRSTLAVVPTVRLFEAAGHTHSTTFSADDYGKLCEIADSCELGIEPDPRYSGFVPRRAESVVLFRLPSQTFGVPSQEFRSAAAVLGIATAVATADEEVVKQEESTLRQMLEDTLALDEHERRRLEAWLKWLVISRPRVRSVLLDAKERLLELPRSERVEIANFTVDVAASDGIVHLKETEILEKIYAGLNLDQMELEDYLDGLDGIHISSLVPGPKEERANADSVLKAKPEPSQTDALMEILFS